MPSRSLGCTPIVVVLLCVFAGATVWQFRLDGDNATSGVIAMFLLLVLPTLVALKIAIHSDQVTEQADKERRRQAEQKASELAQRQRDELARRTWEQSSEGQAVLEQQRREAEEKARVETERRKREAEELAERTARANWRKWHESKTMSEIAEMTGLEFEKFLFELLSQMGFTNLKLTPINDQGGDLVGNSPQGVRTVVQAKRWKNTLGNSVVQELLGAMLHYDAAVGMVITNSTFTDAARQLAGKDQRITLCDGRWLESQIRKFLPPEIPEFTWDKYNERIARPK